VTVTILNADGSVGVSSLTVRLLNKSPLNAGSTQRGRSIKHQPSRSRPQDAYNERHPPTADDEIPIAPRWRF
jgi:hypothetical protein